MNEYDQLIDELKEMRSRFDDGFSSSDRKRIESLYASLLGKTVRKSGCSDCYRDAYIEIYSFLKKLGKMPEKSNYILKPGVVVHPWGTTKYYANANITDAVAEEYLSKDPSNIVEFATYPADWEARVEARKDGKVIEDVSPETVKEANKALTERNEELSQENEELKTKLEIAEEKYDEQVKANAKMELELESVKKELESARKNENACLNDGESIVVESKISKKKKSVVD